MGVGEGGASRAGLALGGRRRGRIVECEAGRAERGRMETEDAGGAETAIDASEANVVEEAGVFGAAVAALSSRCIGIAVDARGCIGF